MRTQAEQYADGLGLQRGSQAWQSAAQDYVLRGNGPTSFGYKDQLQDQRIGSANRNTDVRAGVERDNNIRSTGTSRDNNIRTTGTSRANAQVRADTVRGSHSYKNGGARGGRAGAGSSRPRAKDAQGNVIEFNGTAWVPVR
jgi:hypothetical protein